MSLTGPLVTPNTLETRFGRFAFPIRAFKHPLLTFVALAALAAGAAVATGQLHLPL
jgi:hypothetical protein